MESRPYRHNVKNITFTQLRVKGAVTINCTFVYVFVMFTNFVFNNNQCIIEYYWVKDECNARYLTLKMGTLWNHLMAPILRRQVKWIFSNFWGKVKVSFPYKSVERTVLPRQDNILLVFFWLVTNLTMALTT